MRNLHNLTVLHTVKSKVEILQNFVAFSEYMNLFKTKIYYEYVGHKKINCDLKKELSPIQIAMFFCGNSVWWAVNFIRPRHQN